MYDAGTAKVFSNWFKSL